MKAMQYRGRSNKTTLLQADLIGIRPGAHVPHLFKIGIRDSLRETYAAPCRGLSLLPNTWLG